MASAVGVLDGDTDHPERARLTDGGRLLITNPDMLHCTVLPNHRRFARFLGRLRFLVVDEAHAYQGVFGGHTALVLRRLRRLAWLHGADPTVVVCSATIANPVAHAAALTGLPVSAVRLVSAADDGSPCGEKRFVLWNAPQLGAAGGTSAPAAAAAAAAVVTHDPKQRQVGTRMEQYGEKGKGKRRRASLVPRGKAAVASRLQEETAADDAAAAAAASTSHEGGAPAVEEVPTARKSVKSGGSLKVRPIRRLVGGGCAVHHHGLGLGFHSKSPRASPSDVVQCSCSHIRGGEKWCRRRGRGERRPSWSVRRCWRSVRRTGCARWRSAAHAS